MPWVSRGKAERTARGGRAPAGHGFLAASVLLAFLAACGADEGTSATVALDVFEVLRPAVSPARLRLDATRATRVALFHDAGGGERPMDRLTGPGVSGNEVSLAAGETLLDWDFAAELGSGGFRPGVRVAARSLGGELLPGGELTLALGNDPPVLVLEPVSSEVDGVVPVRFRLADSSSDLVDVRVEFRLERDPPERWNPARPAGLPPGPTPDPALAGIEAPATGSELVFFWDTDFDLAHLERDVRLRFTPLDPVAAGAEVVSDVFRVDNNAEPIVQLQNDAVLANPDERRGIPVPFRVIDEEGDLVDVILQWRREGEAFPPLPSAGAALDAVLGDPELRRELRICTPYPRFASGRSIPVDETTLRLPELAAGESWILASGLEGRALELLRRASLPEPLSPTWKTNPLASPIAALPLGGGWSALVLDAQGGTGRLREIDLATGAVLREIAQTSGTPSAMVFERGGERAVILASELGGAWRVERIELASGMVSELFLADGSTEPPPVRGLASFGEQTLLLSAGSSLLHLDFSDPGAPELAVIRDDLVTPCGLVLDPLSTNRLYVAERDFARADGTGRVLAVELDSHGTLPVVVRTHELLASGLEHPTALALDRGGSRLLAATNETGSRLVALELGAQGGNVSRPLGSTRPGEIVSVASGPEGLLLAAIPDENELLAGGGIEQRRTIVAYEAFDPDRPSGQLATVEPAFAPAVRPGQVWRIQSEPRLRASAQGTDHAFVWNSGADMPAGGPATLRAVGRDDEFGPVAEGRAPKRVRSGLEVTPLVLGGAGETDAPQSVVAGDLDGDGDLDLATANSIGNDLTVLTQQSTGSFAPFPLHLGGAGVTDDPRALLAADVDGDGDLDLAAANFDGSDLTLFFQGLPGTFASPPLRLGGRAVTFHPTHLAAADFDGDGDLDLAVVNWGTNDVALFFQDSPGSFSLFPQRLGGSSASGPLSVVTGDLDRDGELDLAVANSADNDIAVFLQESSGSFAPTPLRLGGVAITERPVALVSADIDGDGSIDLASANADGSDVTVFFQQAPGEFMLTPLRLGGFPVMEGPRSLVASDFDGDGGLDLAAGNASGHFLTVFFQEARGSFAPSPLRLGGFSVTFGPGSLAAADLDGNGSIDLTSANGGRNDLTVFLQESRGSVAPAPDVLGGEGITNVPIALTAADLDDDGDLDLVSANAGPSQLTVFFQQSPGNFALDPLVVGGFELTAGVDSVAAADLDGDGKLDLVSGNYESSDLTIFFQGGSPVPLRLGGLGITDAPVSVAAADLDGDGDLELASANSVGYDLTVFFQESPGNFAPSPLQLGGIGVTDFPGGIVASDVDSDGDFDLASANGFGNLTVFFQESAGRFATSPLELGGFGVTTNPVALVAADLDGDGDLELASANSAGDDLTIFFQESPGGFARSPLRLGGFGLTSGPSSLVATDLDGDGDLELASANWGGDDLAVFFQTAPGSFAPTPLTIGGPGITNYPLSVVAVDLDGDGDVDLASANANGPDLTLFWGGR